jgi:hypothetical protein
LKEAGMDSLQNHFEQSKEKMKTEQLQRILKKFIEVAIPTNNETDFKKLMIKELIQLFEEMIKVVYTE